ncbi:MAG: AmmeMemoRadiSam system protein B [Treponema sp.]|nr:AmmeMemoRadiSam system protein B [Treponema sp.]
MVLRKSALPPGWYPQNKEEIRLFLANISPPLSAAGARAALAPHAGWYYSGAAAALSVSALDRDADTVIVAGGHLPAGAPALFAEEDGAATPLGDIEIDRELRTVLWERLGGAPDRYRDNTVEVLLPLVKHFFPTARLVWLRLPAESRSFEAGKVIAEAARNRKAVLLGSTDLTHYGPNYGFSPHGRGEAALEWVKTVNDRAFIGAVLRGSPAETLERAEKDRSACSAGAALACMGYAQALGAPGAKLLAYSTSADVEAGRVPDSFVGYAALSF